MPWKEFLITAPISVVIGIIWVNMIDNMKKNHPNYKGEDFLNWDGKNPWQIDEKEEEKKDS